MKKRSMTIIFSSLIIAAFAVTMTGCAAREYRTDGSPVSTAPAEVVSTQPSVEENSEEPSEEESSEEPSEEESSEEPSEEESSEEESSEEESEEESSEEESEEESSEEEFEEESSEEESEEESSEEEAEGIKITFVKPEKWDSEVNAYIYNDDKVENAVWPGEAMTDNGDGASTPEWQHNGRCTCCLSCYHHCPRHAINYGSITRRRGQYYFGHPQ